MASNVVPLVPPGAPTVTPPGGPPSGGDVEHRLTALETRLDSVLPTLASKSDIETLRVDVHKIDASISRWILATVLVVVGTTVASVFGALTFLKPVPAPTSLAVQPIVIPWPAPAVTPAPSTPSPETKK